MQNKVLNSIRQIILAVLTIIIALLIGAVLVVFSGNSPIEAYTTLFNGAFGSSQRISEVFVKMIPLSVMAFGVSVAFKANLWNIGGSGQFTMGAICSVLVGLYMGLPAAVAIPVSIIAAVIGGGLWAGFAGWLKTRFNANEVITTLMLNYIATYFLAYLVYGPLMDPNGSLPQTKQLADSLHLPLFAAGMRIHMGILLIPILLIFMLFFWKSTFGFKVDLIGKGEKIATCSGINVKKTVVLTMVISGAITGLAGWNEVYGVQYRLLEGIAGNYGNISVVVALLGGLNPIGITVASFFFSALLVGGATMQRMTDVPYSIVDIVEGLIIVFVIARTAFDLGIFKRVFGKEKTKC